MKMVPSCLVLAVFLLPLVNCQLKTQENIVKQLERSPDFRLLYTVLNATSLVPDLEKNDTKITVFAPNNAAFDALVKSLPNGALDCLLERGQAVLESVLKYHVLPGIIRLPLNSSAAMNYSTLLTGAQLELKSENATTTVVNKDTKVSTPNLLEGTYYLVHVVDKVLLPPDAVSSVLEVCPPVESPASAPSPEVAPSSGTLAATPPTAPPMLPGGPRPMSPSPATRPAVQMVLLTLASAMTMLLLTP